jgi:AcrR family transcriptional regulator
MTTRKISAPRASRRLIGRGGTRQALIDAALSLLDQNKSFDGLSLRELTREVGIVPTAFYRHFSGMDELGLALVDESFRALRQILESIRSDSRSGEKHLSAVVKSLVRHVHKHRLRFRFVASERFGGDRGVRESIRREMRLVQSELATDLARFPILREWSTPDLQMIAILIVNNMVAIVEEILERTESDKSAEKELVDLAEKQMRLIFLGVPNWRSKL